MAKFNQCQFYLQSLILGHLERNTPQDRVQLERRLAELRASEAAADDEFEAGVLVMAGMRDRAIASYRLALAKNPAQGDNYLLLSDLLNQDRRSGEATAILQYFAETAAGDDGFMVAIDGILNAKPAADSPVLAWARRRVLERITQRDDRFYLYDLSAELAQEARDAPAYLASLENALVEAGPRRSSVLRELLAATEDNSASAVSARGVSQADLKLNAAYGRRLIALGEEMPPDVYLNVGRTFLRMGNPAEALDAFNLAIDRLNRPELIEESADRFDASGYSQQAASLYEKALIGDPENVGAMSKLAAVRSRLGAVKLARELYLRALLKLANQQLVEVASSGQARAGNVAADERFSFPFRRYFGALQTSLVFNWEAGDARAASNTVLSAIEEAQALALKDVVERIGGRTSPAINQFPRLDALTGLLRTLALLTGRYEVADRADIRLLANFGRDTTLVAGLVQERLAWGLRPSALRLLQAEGVAAGARANLTATITRGGNLEPYVDLVAAARQALGEGSYANAVELALDAGDNALVLTAYRQWIAAHSSTPTAAARQTVTVTNARNAPQTDVGDGQLTRIATHARGRLSAVDFASVCQQIVGVVTGDPGVARSVLMVATERGLPAVARRRSVLFDLENAVGRRLFNATELSKAISQIDPRQLLSLDLEYVMAGLPADERLALFLRGLEASPPGISAIVLRALGGLLVEPLDDSAAQRVSAVLHGRLRDQSKSQLGLRSLQYLMRASLLTTKIHPRNAAFLAALDQHLVATYPDAPGGAGIFTQVLSPRDSYEAADAARLLDGAFEAYAAVNQRSASAGVPFGLTYFFSNYQGMLSDAAQDAMEDLLNRKVRDEGLTPANFWVTVALLRATPVGVGNKELAWLERTHRERPDHPLVLEALASGYRQRGEIERERQVLDQLLVIMPASEENRRRLAAIWRERDHPEQALAALDGRTAPPTSETSTSSRSGSMETRYPQIATLLAQWSSPGSPQSMADALRGVLQMLPPPGGRSVNYFQQVQSGIPSIPFSVFFGLNLPASTKSDQVGPAAGDATVPMLRWIQGDERVAGEPGQPVALLEGLQTEPFALAPIEAAVRALDPSVVENDSQYRLYASLASMWQLHGRADAEFSRLTEAMRKGEAGKKELLLWMELAVRQPESMVRELTATAEQWLMAAGPLTAYQRIQLARLYARAGLREKAVGAYAVAVTAAALSTTARVVQIGGTSLFSAGGLVADAAKHLDGAGMQLLVTHFLRRAQSADDLGQRQTHQRFLLDLAERAMRTGTPPLAVRPIVESFGMELAAREDLIRLSGLFARLGEVEKGLEALRRALVSRHDPLDRLPGAVRRYFVQEQLPSEIAALMELKTIFPATRKAWANDAGLMWVNRVAAVVPMWLAEPGNAIEPNTGLNLLALLTLRQHQLGQPATKGSAALLASLVQKQGRFSVRTATLAAAVARSVQTPFGAPPLRQLIGDRNLDVSLLASAVRDVAQTEGAKVAFELGESALAYTRNDALLKELESLAGQLGDASRQHELSTMRGAAVRARLLLERGPAES